jgi:hypothetical protein
MKRSILITTSLLIGLFVSVSFASEITSFGAKQYVRTTGKPNVYNDTFPGIVGQGKFIIKNGDANGKNRVSSASIIVNGRQVLGPNSFNQKVYNIVVPVNLAENNTISVDLRSGPGGYLTIRVVQEAEGEVATKLTTLVFSDALERANTAKALDFVLESEKDKFKEIFSNLGNEGVRELGETLKNATPVFIGESYAEYQSIVTFPNGDQVIGKFSLINTSEGWRFTQL